MTDTRKDYEIARDDLAALMAREALRVEATFIPFSVSRNAKPDKKNGKPWRSLNWKVRLMKAARVLVETDYSAGEGHTPTGKANGSSKRTVTVDQLIAWECENGFPAVETFVAGIVRKPGSKPLKPDPVDVFASMLTDSDVINYSSFEDWASSLGYDTDSRKMEATYRACLATALALRNGIGDAVMTEAAELAGRL